MTENGSAPKGGTESPDGLRSTDPEGLKELAGRPAASTTPGPPCGQCNECPCTEARQGEDLCGKCASCNCAASGRYSPQKVIGWAFLRQPRLVKVTKTAGGLALRFDDVMFEVVAAEGPKGVPLSELVGHRVASLLMEDGTLRLARAPEAEG